MRASLTFGFLILAGIQDPVRLGAFLFVLSVAVESFRPAVLASTAEFAPAPSVFSSLSPWNIDPPSVLKL